VINTPDSPARTPDNLRVGGPDLAPDLAGHGGEGEQVVAGIGEVGRGGRELAVQGFDHPAELGVHLGGVGLVEDGPHQGGHPRLTGLAHLGQQIAQVVKP